MLVARSPEALATLIVLSDGRLARLEQVVVDQLRNSELKAAAMAGDDDERAGAAT